MALMTSEANEARRDAADPTPDATTLGNTATAKLPWMQWQVGERVVLRYRLEDGLHDALGDVLEVAADHVTVRTRRGDIRVEATTMVTGKRVPPARW